MDVIKTKRLANKQEDVIKRTMTALLFIFAIFLLFTSCGNEPVGPKGTLPKFNSFTISPSDITITENAVISWDVSNADSIYIRDFNVTFANLAKGSYTCIPTKTTTYTGIAYNKYGIDSAKIDVTVKRLGAKNGKYYKAIMGTDSTEKLLELTLFGSDGLPFSDTLISIAIIEGDGTLLSDTVRTDLFGKALISYTFDGLLGHAHLRATFNNMESVDFFVRANTLIYGNSGQAQYVLFDDRLGDIKNFNGEPNSIDVLGDDVIIVIANYEATLGMVILIYDPDTDGIVTDSSHVFGVIVVDSVFPQPPDSSTFSARYEGKTSDSVGIGSFFWRDIFVQMGDPFPIFSAVVDDPILPYIKINYDTRKFEFLCEPIDTAVFQIYLREDLDSSLFLSGSLDYQNIIYPALGRYFK